MLLLMNDSQDCKFKNILNENRTQSAEWLPHRFRAWFNQVCWSQTTKYSIDNLAIEHRKKSRFNPYTMNYGTVVAVAGSDFVVVAGDTRLSEGYSIVTRS